MPIESIIVVSIVSLAFLAFIAVVAWAERRTSDLSA